MTKRRPLPKGSVGDIQQALAHNAAAAQMVLAIARHPGSDGRLAQVLQYIHESSMALRCAMDVKPVPPNDICDRIVQTLGLDPEMEKQLLAIILQSDGQI